MSHIFDAIRDRRRRRRKLEDSAGLLGCTSGDDGERTAQPAPMVMSARMVAVPALPPGLSYGR